jgi:hypothetical protein
VSDTPDPTYAQFKAKEPEKVADMFYFEEDVKQEHVSEVFDNLEDIVNTTSDEEANDEGGEQ